VRLHVSPCAPSLEQVKVDVSSEGHEASFRPCLEAACLAESILPRITSAKEQVRRAELRDPLVSYLRGQSHLLVLLTVALE